MLTTQQTTTIVGRSIIDGKEVCKFQASINSANPKEMSFSSWQLDKEAYKNNRSVCRADEATFEDHCYVIQDEMIAALGGSTNEN